MNIRYFPQSDEFEFDVLLDFSFVAANDCLQLFFGLWVVDPITGFLSGRFQSI